MSKICDYAGLTPLQQLAAKYLYDPFGNMLALSGPLRSFNKYRYSSKEWNDNSGLYYYLYRLYNPSLQKWLTRDPMGEFGEANLYGMLANDPINVIDAKGLCGCKCKSVRYGDPASGLAVVPIGPGTYNIGVAVPYTIEVEGDPSKCHCSYYDDGTITATGHYKNGAILDDPKTYDHKPYIIACSSGLDSPGFNLTSSAPDLGFSANITITYDWVGTVVCQGDDGPMFDTATLNEADSGHLHSPNRSN